MGLESDQDKGLQTYMILSDHMNKNSEEKKPMVSELERSSVVKRPDTEVFRFKKPLKIDGRIGGAKEKDKLTFVNLNWEITNAELAGYSESEICAAVVKAISPSHHLRAFFEGKPELKLDVLRGVLKSHFREKDSGSVFSELCTTVQESTESASDFVLRLLCLRQKVADLSVEEDCQYTDSMLRKQFFKTMFNGLRNSNIRVELREKCGQDTGKLKDEEILSYVAQVTANEIDRNEKLNPKKKV